jgi:hypothetical protein
MVHAQFDEGIDIRPQPVITVLWHPQSRSTWRLTNRCELWLLFYFPMIAMRAACLECDSAPKTLKTASLPTKL